uniref:Polynucleotide kinase n=2 Tax=unclassified bacterial viruses TaxID=12333 RepID=A0AAU6VZ65_9VIRU
MSHLYLIRGLPGSGKSTFAETLKDALDVLDYYEADDLFYIRRNGVEVYEFDADKLYEAHKYCQGVAERCMSNGDANVIVSNTFTTERELKPYLELAEKYGYRVTSLVVENRHGNASIHGVPEETMTKMRNRFSIKI